MKKSKRTTQYKTQVVVKIEVILLLHKTILHNFILIYKFYFLNHFLKRAFLSHNFQQITHNMF